MSTSDKTAFLLRIDPETKERLRIRAEERHWSLNKYLVLLLQDLTKNDGEEGADEDQADSDRD